MRYHDFLFVAICFFLVCAMPSKDTVAAQSSATEVHGLVEEVKGEVTYEYGARFRASPLMLNQTWQSGDVIRTGKDSSVTLKMEATGDVITVGEESELYFSTKNNNLYFHILKGTAFILAEKRESEAHAMYVLSGEEAYKIVGTQFIVSVDPYTGGSQLSVMSGIVNRQNQRANNLDDQFIFPGQTSHSTIQDPLRTISEDLERVLDEEIIRVILENFQMAQLENEELLKKLKENGFSGFPLVPVDFKDAERVQENLERLIANMVRSAMEQNRVSEEEIRALINDINQDLKRPLDIDSSEPYDPRLRDKEKAMREQLERQQEQQRQRQQAEQERQQEIQERNKELLNRLAVEQERKKDEQARLRQEKQDELRKQLEELRTPPPPPRPSRPDPEIEPEKLEVTLNRQLFSIDAEWSYDEKYHSYRFYLNNVIVEHDQDIINPFEFKNLRPDKDYTIKIEALDEAGKVLARFEAKSVKIADLNIVDFNSYVSGNSIYVWFEDTEKPVNYSVWIEGEEIGCLGPYDENLYVFNNPDFEIPAEEFELHLYAEEIEGEPIKRYYGSDIVSPVEYKREGILEVLNLTKNTAHIYWIPPFNDENNPLNSYLFLYRLISDENGDETWESVGGKDDYNEPVIFSELDPNTHYKISECVDGEEEPLREIEFKTKEE